MAPDTAAIFAGLIGAADDDVFELLRIERALLDDLRNDRSQHVVGPHPGERPGMAAERGAQGVVDVAVEHGRFLLASISPRPTAAVKSPVWQSNGPWDRRRSGHSTRTWRDVAATRKFPLPREDTGK